MNAKAKRNGLALARYSDEPPEMFFGPYKAGETAIIASLLPPNGNGAAVRRKDQDAALKNVGVCPDCCGQTIDQPTGHRGLQTTWYVRCATCGYGKDGVSR